MTKSTSSPLPHGDMIKLFFQFQLDLKMYHWNTRAYSRHISSDQLMERFLKLVDRFVEVFIGHYGRPEISRQTIEYTIKTDAEMPGYVQAFADKIQGWKKLPVDLENVRDDIVESVYQALYLFSLH